MTIRIESSDSKELQQAAMGSENTEEQSAPENSEKPDEETEEEPEQKPAAKSDNAETEESEKSEDDAEDEESDEDSESKDESEDTEEEKPKKRKSGFQKRINKLNAKLANKDQEIDYWKKKALEGDKPESKQEPESKDGKPDPNDFESNEDYLEKLAEWKADQIIEKREQERNKKAQKKSHAEKIKSHAKRVQDFSEQTEDFFEVLDDVGHIETTPSMESLLIESENGPELMYALAKDPEEFERLNSLPPMAMSRELGKFEAKLSAPSESVKPKKKTKAPKPASTVKGKGATVEKSIYDPDISQAEYERIRMKQRLKAS